MTRIYDNGSTSIRLTSTIKTITTTITYGEHYNHTIIWMATTRRITIYANNNNKNNKYTINSNEIKSDKTNIDNKSHITRKEEE